MNTSAFAQVYQRFGLGAMLHDLFISALSKLCFFRVLVIYVKDQQTPALEIPAHVDIHLMPQDELARYADRDGLELPGFFLREAQENGDHCFGVFIDDELCGYAWYALKESTSARGVTTWFSSDYVYAYKNMTLEKYKGLGIQKWIKAFTFDYYQKMGKKGLIVAIESQNFSSRRSTAGSGGKIVGLWPFAIGERWYWGFGSPGCKRVGYRMTDARPHSLHQTSSGRAQK